MTFSIVARFAFKDLHYNFVPLKYELDAVSDLVLYENGLHFTAQNAYFCSSRLVI